MADVTSTARLVVEVVGEEKIKALAAQLAALGKAGGGKLGLAADAANIKVQQAGIARTLAPVVAQQRNIAKALTPVVAQQALLAKTLAPITAGQVSLAKTLAPMQAQQVSLAKTLGAAAITGKLVQPWRVTTPEGKPAAFQAASAAAAAARPSTAAVLATQAAAQAAVGKLATPAAAVQAAASKAAVAAAAKVVTPSVVAAAVQSAAVGGMSANLIKSIQRRSGGTEEEIRKRFATPGTGLGPLGKAELAKRAAMGLPALAEGGAAGLAEGAAGSVALRAGIVGLGTAAAIAAVPVLAVVGAVSAMAGAMKIASGDALEHSKNVLALVGPAKRAGLTLDQLQEQRLAGERVLGEQYETFEKRLPRLLDTRNKMAKAALASLGLSPEEIGKFEAQAGRKFGGLDFIQKVQEKREALENKIAAAKTAKEKAAAEKNLRTFDDNTTRAVRSKEIADKIAAGKAEETARALEDAQRVTTFGPKESQEKQIADAKRLQREQQLTAANSASFSARIGSAASESLGNVMETWRTKFQEVMGKPMADVTGQLARIGFEGLNEGLKLLAPAASAAASGVQALADTLAGIKFSDITKGISDWWDERKKAMEQLDKDAAKPPEGAPTAFDKFKEMWETLFPKIPEKPPEPPEPVTPQERIEQAFDVFQPAIKKMEEQLIQVVPLPTPRPSEEEIQRAPKDILGDLGGAGDQIRISIESAAAAFAPVATAGIAESGTQGGTNFGAATEPGINAAGSSGGSAFSAAAGAGITEAGSAGGAAFASAIDASSIGSAIGAAAAAAISGASVNVNVNAAGAAVGGARGGGADTGHDKASGTTGP